VAISSDWTADDAEIETGLIASRLRAIPPEHRRSVLLRAFHLLADSEVGFEVPIDIPGEGPEEPPLPEDEEVVDLFGGRG
jgi:hypothetical protein